MTTVTISLPETLKTFIGEQLATKGYGNVSEYYRSLLRNAQEREEDTWIEPLLAEGLATGGDDIPVPRAFWQDLKTEALGLAKKHRSRKGFVQHIVRPAEKRAIIRQFSVLPAGGRALSMPWTNPLKPSARCRTLAR
jgi:antitoxin ParD1/3/4